MKSSLSVRKKEILTGYMFLLPWLAGILIFVLFPLIYSVLLSFNAVNITPSEGIKLTYKGLQYYNHAWNVDTQFKLNLGETIFMISCAAPVIQVFSLIISMLLNTQIKLKGFFRTLFFLPVIIMSGPVISKLLTRYTVDFAEAGSSVYIFISALPSFLRNPSMLILNNLVLIFWFSGLQILLYLNGLQKISPDLYEAAQIDGASSWETFWKITLPHMNPFIVICTVYTIIDLAAYSENSVNKKISSHIFDFDQLYSFSASMAWIYFLVIILLLVVLYLLFKLLGRRSGK